MNRIVGKFLMFSPIIIFLAVICAPSVRGEIEEVKVRVKGLSCPFCVYGVEKQFKALAGIDTVETNLKKGELSLHYQPEAVFDLENINKAIKVGGFTPGEIEITVTGYVEKKEDRLIFLVKDSKSSFLLCEETELVQELHPASEPPITISQETKEKLSKVAHPDNTIRISGKVHAHQDMPPGLSVIKWKVLSPEEPDEIIGKPEENQHEE